MAAGTTHQAQHTPAHDTADHTEVVATLRTMASVLSRHGYGGHAAFVEKLAQLAETGDPAFADKVGSATMWGGSGAVWEVNLHWGTPRPDEARADELRFRTAVSLLARYLNERGIGSDNARRAARDIAATFEQWTQHEL